MNISIPNSPVSNTIPCSFTEIRSYRGLPVGYKRLNYIEATGSQVISTDIFNDDPNPEVSFEVIPKGKDLFPSLFQWPIQLNLMALGFSCSGYTSTAMIFRPGDWASRQCTGENAVNVLDSKHEITLKKIGSQYGMIVDGVSWSSLGAAGGMGERYNYPEKKPLLFFNSYPRQDTGYTDYRIGKWVIYYFQIREYGELTHDIIPVLDRYGVPCLYDLITRKTYYNTGTGQFLWG